MMKNMKIGITGPISESNFGDYAMFVNNIYDLNLKDIILFVYNEDVLAPICKDYLGQYNFEIQIISFLENNKIDNHLNDRISQKVGFQTFRFPTYTPGSLISFITTDPAPIKVFSDIFMFWIIIVPVPIKELLPMYVPPLNIAPGPM